ncbi:DUF3883 domain-containing protein [Neobacillus sp. 179-C4.2 HS]|uniref:DUF3883 domain-containing protein n=1 Tax=Neobacillus driksii TaxID=3035913 RepID=A0ABV4YRH1_9BACI|nr:DUF3883 domain-containing protein [Neobacillus sp. 179.-C4.2 HS]MDP5195035.1 DUF3883 domain-containing protein [Neobacillus sp. 179.-C4.2 HS]
MNLIRVLTVDSVVPVLRISADLNSWSTQNEPVEITSYDSKLDELFQEIERHQTAEELLEEQHRNQEGLDWIEEDKIRGELGEKLALNFLQSQYSQVESVSHIASKGYDIEVISEDAILGFEIKTSRTVNKFYITYNELQKAYTMKDNYFLFFIYMEQLENEDYSCYGIIINNPIKELQLDFLKLTEPLQTGMAEIILHSFRISMDKDFLESYNIIYL